MSLDISTIETNLAAALDYEETGSLSKAKAVITYCNQWLLRPSGASHAASNLSFDMNQVRMLRDEARAYVKSNTAGQRVAFLTLDRDGRR